MTPGPAESFARKRRGAGLLLHPTSLAGPHGVGDLGPEARRVVDWAAAAGLSWWQVLPLHPTAGTSPYDALSTFAGNPLLISPERLVEDGLLRPADLAILADLPIEQVDFSRAAQRKEMLLRLAWERLARRHRDPRHEEIAAFADAQSSWLADWILFAALRRRLGVPWWTWPDELRRRDAEALRRAECELADEIAYERFVQWAFLGGWRTLRAHAHDAGVYLIGDLPIYVAHDSAEVWSRPDLFELDPDGRPTAVSGVPPDAFSDDGQLWRHPLYRWSAHAAEGFAWWRRRARFAAELCDLVRLDHFRGFAAYWSVPTEAETAAEGRWIEGPGHALFDALHDELGGLPFVAEDLGDIGPEVEALRREIAIPGTRVLQFGLDEGSPHAPGAVGPDAVFYTGTHDNDTTRGWLDGLDEHGRHRLRSLTGVGARDPEAVRALLGVALGTAASLVVLPLQDILSLGSEARMNTPGTVEANWTWRVDVRRLTADAAGELRELVASAGRLPG